MRKIKLSEAQKMQILCTMGILDAARCWLNTTNGEHVDSKRIQNALKKNLRLCAQSLKLTESETLELLIDTRNLLGFDFAIPGLEDL